MPQVEETPCLEDNKWIIPLFAFLTKVINDGKCNPVKGKRASVIRAPDELNPKELDKCLQKFPHVKQLQHLAHQWMEMPSVKPLISKDVRAKLPQQVSLYKRGSLARNANAEKNSELKRLRAIETQMKKSTAEAEKIRYQLRCARNAAEHCQRNEAHEAEIRREITRLKRRKKSDEVVRVEAPENLFDDLSSSQGFQEG